MSTKAKKDPAQQFIASKSARVRVLAGPGTGKSYCLKNRILHLLHHVRDEGVEPEKILVLTFTSIAVQDLKNSLIELAKENPGLDLKSVEVSTLHSLALRQYATVSSNRMRMMEDFEADMMLRDIGPDLGNIRSKKTLLNYGNKNDKKYISLVNDFKQWKQKHNGFTLSDIICEMRDILKTNASVRDRLCYQSVLVDEYQDLNCDEQEYVELLTAEKGSLAVIGDDDQSIYEFKGASPEGIRNYVINNTNCEDIRFSICRRCPKTVVRLAKNLINKNEERVKKEFFAYKKNKRGKCELISATTDDEEIELICKKIKEERNARIKPKSIVVLTPNKNRGIKLYNELKKEIADVEHCFRSHLLECKKVCESIAYITLASDAGDMISWRYLLGSRSDNGYAKSYIELYAIAEKENKDVLTVFDECSTGRRLKNVNSLLINRYDTVRSNLKKVMADPKELFRLLDGNGGKKEEDVDIYRSILREIMDERFQSEGFRGVRKAVLKEVHSMEAAADSKKVRIMTLHGSKGLSAQLVIVMSAVEGLIPLKSKSIEEQRRLFYVAITRCKGGKRGEYPGKIVISKYERSTGGVKQTPSRFVAEMKPNRKMLKKWCDNKENRQKNRKRND